MAVVRRVYLYGIAFVALGMLVFGAAGLLEVGLEQLVRAVSQSVGAAGENTLRNQLSFAAATAAIGLVAWLFHWLLADRAARRPGPAGAGERGSAIRKLYLYAVVLVGGIILAVNLSDLLTDVLRLAFGELAASRVIVGDLVGPLSRLLVGALFAAYCLRVAAADRAALPETGAGATLRRWAGYGLSGFGLFYALFAAASLFLLLVQSAWTPPAAPSPRFVAGAYAGSVGGLLAGIACWTAAWSWTNRWPWATGASPERRSTLRKVYLYLVLAVTIAWTLWNLGQILYRTLQSWLIPLDRGASLVSDLGYSFGAAALFGVAWLYHGRVVRREAADAPESEVVIRWLYGYLLALIALLTAGWGVASLLSTVLERFFVPPAAGRTADAWLDPLCFSLTLLAVGLPVWAVQWTRLQREAAALRDGPGIRRPAALVRRLFFFAVFTVAVLTLLVRVVTTLYGAFQLLLGEPWSPSKGGDLIEALAYSLVAALFLAYHLRIFRADAASGAAAETVPEPTQAPAAPLAAVEAGRVTLLVARAPDAARLAALRDELRARAADGVEWLMVDVDAPTAERLLAGQ